jgi:hypothetical protein
VAKTYGWNKYRNEAKVKPFVVDELPEWHPASEEQGGPGSLTIPIPDAEAFLTAEAAQTAGESLRLLCGPQWDPVRLLLVGGEANGDGTKPGEAIPMPGVVALVQDVTRHFSLAEEDRPPVVGRR